MARKKNKPLVAEETPVAAVNDPVLRRRLRDADPRHPVTWRHDRVRKLIEDGKSEPVPRRDDRYISEVLTFMLAYEAVARRVRNPLNLYEARIPVIAQNPCFYFAYDIFLGSEDGLKSELEARILAGQNDIQIAYKLGCEPATVDWYEKMFFNVRERLYNTGYICNQIIYPAAINGSSVNDTNNPDLTAKFFGYFAGPVVLDVIIQKFDIFGQKRPVSGDASIAFFDEHYNLHLRRRSAEAVNSFEINKYNVMQLFEIHAQLLVAAQKVRQDGDQLSTLEENIDITLRSLPWSVGEERNNALEQSPLSPYYGKSSELRVDELVGVVSQGTKPTGLSEYSNFKYPEPKRMESSKNEAA